MGMKDFFLLLISDKFCIDDETICKESWLSSMTNADQGLLRDSKVPCSSFYHRLSAATEKHSHSHTMTLQHIVKFAAGILLIFVSCTMADPLCCRQMSRGGLWRL